jgi:hypothetical protein
MPEGVYYLDCCRGDKDDEQRGRRGLSIGTVTVTVAGSRPAFDVRWECCRRPIAIEVILRTLGRNKYDDAQIRQGFRHHDMVLKQHHSVPWRGKMGNALAKIADVVLRPQTPKISTDDV